jgi:hypothetical protein
MRACNDINFLDSYWSEAKKIATTIEENLPIGIGEQRQPLYSEGGVKMYIVNFSDLKDSWLPQDIINDVSGRSTKLMALANKISVMIHKGRGDAVKRMVNAICFNGTKKLTRYHNYGTKHQQGDFLGYGHFKWNGQAYTLNAMEIKHIKNYFKL